MSLFQRIKTPFLDTDDDDMPPPRSRARPVGEVLRERREEVHLDLDQIGEVLRIKPAYLAAIEQNRPQELPGPTYAIGFVRAYAQHLGLDSERVLDRYKAQSAEIHARPDLSLPVPLGERSVPGGPILLVALILAICGYGTWYYLSTGERNRPERVAAVPTVLQLPPAQDSSSAGAGDTTAGPGAGAAAVAPAPGPQLGSGLLAPPAPDTAAPSGPAIASPAAAGAPPSPASTASPQPAGVKPAEPSIAAAGANPRKAAGENTTAALPPPQAVPADSQAPSAAAAQAGETQAGGASRIEVRAVSDCWIQVRAPDQSIVFSRVLKAGETYRVPGRSGLVMRTGNAGALAIAVDGKPVPSIGAVGALRRNVVLEPDALIGGTAVHG